MKLEVRPDAKALIFDLDGTLADTMPLHLKAWQNTCRDYNFEYPVEQFYPMAGLSSEKITGILIDRFGLDSSINIQEFTKKKESAFLDLRDQITPVAPVVELVYHYFGILPMAIGSGGSRTAVHQTLDTLSLKPYFNVIIAAGDVENHKPAPDTFLKCAQLLGVAPRFCHVFEDGERGIEAAKRAGMHVTDITPWHPKHAGR